MNWKMKIDQFIQIVSILNRPLRLISTFLFLFYGHISVY